MNGVLGKENEFFLKIYKMMNDSVTFVRRLAIFLLYIVLVHVTGLFAFDIMTNCVNVKDLLINTKFGTRNKNCWIWLQHCIKRQKVIPSGWML